MTQEQTAPTEFRPYGHIEDGPLLRIYQEALNQMDEASRKAGKIMLEMRARIRERHATGILDETFDCRTEPTTSYDRTQWAPLRRLLPANELAKCYTPAYEDTVTIPERWDAGQVKAVCKRGGARALEIFEASMIPGDPKFIFKYHPDKDPRKQPAAP